MASTSRPAPLVPTAILAIGRSQILGRWVRLSLKSLSWSLLWELEIFQASPAPSPSPFHPSEATLDVAVSVRSSSQGRGVVARLKLTAGQGCKDMSPVPAAPARCCMCPVSPPISNSTHSPRFLCIAFQPGVTFFSKSGDVFATRLFPKEAAQRNI